MAKIAIVHEWLDERGGAETVLEELLHVFPDADVFAIVDFMKPADRAFLGGRPVKTTFLQHMPRSRRYFRNYLPLMPLAIEQLDLTAYDLVLSSSHAVAKGVITGPDQLHVSYVHSPMRYAWDLQHEYLRQSRLRSGVRGWAVRSVLHYLRTWDVRTANGVDRFIANSNFIARRIWKTYRREADVVYPPVDVDRFALCGEREDYFITTSRLVPYKRVGTIVEAFASMPNRRLKVVGDGPEIERLRAAAPPNVEVMGRLPADDVVSLTQRARAFVFASLEDFGIAPVEAQACGTPVIAYGRGGAAESVVGLDAQEPTGILFGEQTTAAIVEAVTTFVANEHRFTPQKIRENALRFSPEAFRRGIGAALRRAGFTTDR